MELKINYSYREKYLPTKRHRNEREREIEDSMTVNVRELTESEFPIAFIVHDTSSLYIGAKHYDDFNDTRENRYCIVPEEIRTINGRLYKAVRVTHGAAVSDIFVNPKEYLKDNIERGMRYYHYLYGEDASSFTENSIVTYSDKRIRRNAVRKFAKNCFVFDNKAWIECDEPMYYINTFGLGHNHGGTGFFIGECYNPNIGNKNYFNALQYDEAVAYGKAIATRRGDTESVDSIGKFGDEKKYIEVLMPEMVKRNPNKEHGEGDEFMNTINSIIDNSESVMEAGLLTMAFAFAGI